MSDRDALLQIKPLIDQVKAIVDAALGVAPPTGTDPKRAACEARVYGLYKEAENRDPSQVDAGGFEFHVGNCMAGMTEDQQRADFGLPPKGSTPTPTPPGGNPAAIVPWSPWNQTAKHHSMPSGHIGAWAVPAEPFAQGRVAVKFTQGQMGMGWTPSSCKTEIQLGPSPGVFDPARPIQSSSFLNNNGIEVSKDMVEGQPQQYVNVRWTYPEGSGLGFSIQWA